MTWRINFRPDAHDQLDRVSDTNREAVLDEHRQRLQTDTGGSERTATAWSASSASSSSLTALRGASTNAAALRLTFPHRSA